MGRPAFLNETILRKIAYKKESKDGIISIRKSVCAKARRLGVSSPVALVLIARELNIGTATYQSNLNTEQRAELSNALSKQVTTNTPTLKIGSKKNKIATRTKIIEVFDYDTTDHFKKGHINELNKAYTSYCYTSVFILGRKIIENLIIDILIKKYPEQVLKNKELYFDTAQNRLKDFGVIISNLRSKKNDFGSENKAVERLCDLARTLKDDANDKTHSWYHLVENRKEIDNLNLRAIIELIKKLEESVGIR